MSSLPRRTTTLSLSGLSGGAAGISGFSSTHAGEVDGQRNNASELDIRRQLHLPARAIVSSRLFATLTSWIAEWT